MSEIKMKNKVTLINLDKSIMKTFVIACDDYASSQLTV